MGLKNQHKIKKTVQTFSWIAPKGPLLSWETKGFTALGFAPAAARDRSFL